MRRGMVIDLKRCIGCHACTIACKLENATPPGVFYARVLEMETGKYPLAKRVFLPVLCNHCQDPPCLRACPSGATTQGADGTVLVDQDKCIGCKACVEACPYEARFFLEEIRGYYGDELTPFEKVGYRKHQKGTVAKCNFCAERTASGLEPACVQTCPAVARVFGDLEDPLSEASRLIRERSCIQLRPEQGTLPSVYYIP
ncbi:MAG: 4Fe-4S dicluster domain-containing protein [Chloroflexi bacterium]|nr:4Fe-4S dicluster domain-containing protein [Chloroflexota bacterium]